MTIGSLAPGVGGLVANILGPVRIGNPNGHTAVVVDDSGDTAARTITLVNQTDTSTNTIDLGNDPTTTFPIRMRGPQVSSVTIDGGSGGNIFQVLGSFAGQPLTVNAGSDNDLVRLGNGSYVLGYFQAPVTVHGSRNTTGLTISNVAFGGHASTFTLTSNSVTRDGVAPIQRSTCAWEQT